MKRIRLANLPTKINRLDRLSEELGANIYIKRDDQTGSELTGNKVRKLEFEAADALDGVRKKAAPQLARLVSEQMAFLEMGEDSSIPSSERHRLKATYAWPSAKHRLRSRITWSKV